MQEETDFVRLTNLAHLGNAILLQPGLVVRPRCLDCTDSQIQRDGRRSCFGRHSELVQRSALDADMNLERGTLQLGAFRVFFRLFIFA